MESALCDRKVSEPCYRLTEEALAARTKTETDSIGVVHSNIITEAMSD